MPDSDDKTFETLQPGYPILNYTIVKVLGRGGFGITYLAHDNDAGIDVVIKENMPPQFCMRGADSQVLARAGASMSDSYKWSLDSFKKEAETLQRLQHPNIVRGIEFIKGNGTAYYVMQRVDGVDLRTASTARDNSEGFLTAVAARLLGALSYVHSKNVLHRDIKPANILVTAEGEPVLIDFGAARALISEHTQTMVQSHGYTPMEQLQSHGNTGPWTDLYALGATLYTLVAGERPPASTDRIGAVDCYIPLAGRAELRGRYGRDFLAGIDRALALWPENRWQTAGEWLQAVQTPSTKVKNKGPKHFRRKDEPHAKEKRTAGRTKGNKLKAGPVNPVDLYTKGSRHANGDGVKQDEAQAAERFRNAAEQGLSGARNILGYMYGHGLAIAKHAAKALKWCLKTAGRGYVAAQHNMVAVWEKGKGVVKDATKARGTGVKKDETKPAERNRKVAGQKPCEIRARCMGAAMEWKRWWPRLWSGIAKLLNQGRTKR